MSWPVTVSLHLKSLQSGLFFLVYQLHNICVAQKKLHTSVTSHHLLEFYFLVRNVTLSILIMFTSHVPILTTVMRFHSRVYTVIRLLVILIMA